MPLTLVESCTMPDGTVLDAPSTEAVRVVSAEAANQTLQAMETIVSKGPSGNLLRVPGYRIAAKTGTAEIAEHGIYTNERIVTVAGIFPADNPEYAVIVTLGKPDIMKNVERSGRTIPQHRDSGDQDFPHRTLDRTRAGCASHLVRPESK